MSLSTRRSLLATAVSMALTAGIGGFVTPSVQAQPAPVATGAIRIAIANTQHIFNEMAETKSLQAQLKQQQSQFEQEQRGKLAELEDMRNRRNYLDPNAPQWADINSQLSKKVAEYKIWLETRKNTAESENKQKMVQLFKKIEETVAEVAKRDNIELVLTDNREPIPVDVDEIDSRTLRGMILSRDVLYSTSQIDLTQTVLTLMDARFRGLAGGAANK